MELAELQKYIAADKIRYWVINAPDSVDSFVLDFKDKGIDGILKLAELINKGYEVRWVGIAGQMLDVGVGLPT